MKIDVESRDFFKDPFTETELKKIIINFIMEMDKKLIVLIWRQLEFLKKRILINFLFLYGLIFLLVLYFLKLQLDVKLTLGILPLV